MSPNFFRCNFCDSTSISFIVISFHQIPLTWWKTYTGRFLDETCSYKSCSVCAWKNEPTFTLRGLCTNTLIDKYYVLLPKLTYNEHVFFFGFGDNNIVYSKKERSWLIVGDLQSELFQFKIIKEPKKIVGAFKPDRFSNQMPIGMQSWNITDCGGLISLKLSPVSTNKY